MESSSRKHPPEVCGRGFGTPRVNIRIKLTNLIKFQRDMLRKALAENFDCFLVDVVVGVLV